MPTALPWLSGVTSRTAIRVISGFGAIPAGDPRKKRPITFGSIPEPLMFFPIAPTKSPMQIAETSSHGAPGITSIVAWAMAGAREKTAA